MDLISYGSVSKDFKIIAQLSKLLTKIKNGEIPQDRLDCYSVDKNISTNLKGEIYNKFKSSNLDIPTSSEVFLPSMNYPSHVDEGGTSYFIPLEEGRFLIENVSYLIVPFVLYAFEDSKLHNTNFGAIMLK